MADQLCTPEDLASALQQPLGDLNAATLTLWAECATAVVQSAAGQRIVEVVDDELELIGTTDSWLALPQIPVTAVLSVELDGVALSEGRGAEQYRLRGNRLWRTCGWQQYCGEPSDVVVVCTHGYAAGRQELQLARAATIGLAKLPYVNPSGVSSESIDDYNVSYDRMSAQMEATPYLKAALRKQYGRRAGLVRIG